MRPNPVSIGVKTVSFLCLLAFSTSTALAADPAAELASFSVFPKVDLAQLSKGREAGPRRFSGRRSDAFCPDSLRGATFTGRVAGENAGLESRRAIRT